MRGRLASLTSRLVLTTVVLILVASAVIGVVTALAMRSYLTDQLDHQAGEALDRSLRGGPGGGPGPGNEIGTVTAIYPDHGAASGQHLVEGTDEPVEWEPLPDAAVDDLADVPADGDAHGVEVAGLGGYRAVARDLSDGTLVIAIPTADVDDAIGQLIWWEVVLTMVAKTWAAAA